VKESSFNWISAKKKSTKTVKETRFYTPFNWLVRIDHTCEGSNKAPPEDCSHIKIYDRIDVQVDICIYIYLKLYTHIICMYISTVNNMYIYIKYSYVYMLSPSERQNDYDDAKSHLSNYKQHWKNTQQDVWQEHVRMDISSKTEAFQFWRACQRCAKNHIQMFWHAYLQLIGSILHLQEVWQGNFGVRTMQIEFWRRRVFFPVIRICISKV